MSQIQLDEQVIKVAEELKHAKATIGLWNKGLKTSKIIIGT